MQFTPTDLRANVSGRADPAPPLLGAHVDSYGRFQGRIPGVLAGLLDHALASKSVGSSIPVQLRAVDVEFGDVRESGGPSFKSRVQTISFWIRPVARGNEQLGQESLGLYETPYFFDVPCPTPNGSVCWKGQERAPVAFVVPTPGPHFRANAASDGHVYYEATIRGAYGPLVRLRITGTVSSHSRSGTNRIEVEIGSKSSGTRMTLGDFIQRLPCSEEESRALVRNYRQFVDGKPRMRGRPTRRHLASVADALFSPWSTFSLGQRGRLELNRRLKLKETAHCLTVPDVTAAIEYLIHLFQCAPGYEVDDPNHLKNLQVRLLGDHLELALRRTIAGFQTRLDKAIAKQHSLMEASEKDQEQARPYLGPDVARLVQRELGLSSLFEAQVDRLCTEGLLQVLDRTNPLAEVSHKRKVTWFGPGGVNSTRGQEERRDVHYSHYGRLCPVETPEGERVGLNLFLATHARVDEGGHLLAPYRAVDADSPTEKEVEWCSPADEEEIGRRSGFLAPYGPVPVSEGQTVLARASFDTERGEPGEVIRSVSTDQVRFLDSFPGQVLGVSASLIPFIAHDDGARAMMAAKNLKEALPLVDPRPPVVKTGMEQRVARESGRCVLAEGVGQVLAVFPGSIRVRYDNEAPGSELGAVEREYELAGYAPTPTGTGIFHVACVKEGDRVRQGDVLADGPATYHGELALGRDVLVAYLSWKGLNFEDAIVVSSRLVDEDILTSLHVEELSIDLGEGEALEAPEAGDDRFAPDGLIRIGATVKGGDVVLRKASRQRGANPNESPHVGLLTKAPPEEEGAMPLEDKENECEVPWGVRGEVREVLKEELPVGGQRIRVRILVRRKLQEGDKLQGRHGNKGVVGAIIPTAKMPRLEDGTPIDVILNPLGIPSRMNVGQLLETHLGWLAHRQERSFTVLPFEEYDLDRLAAELQKAGLKDGKTWLTDPETGKRYHCVIGYAYIVKLNHLAEPKEKVRGTGHYYSQVTLQPVKGPGGGQRLGEMEVWALLGYNVPHLLQEFLTVKSDSVPERLLLEESSYLKDLAPTVPESFRVFAYLLRGMGLHPQVLVKDRFVDALLFDSPPKVEDVMGVGLKLASPNDVKGWAKGEVSDVTMLENPLRGEFLCECTYAFMGGPANSWCIKCRKPVRHRPRLAWTARIAEGGLLSREIFGYFKPEGDRRERMSRIDLQKSPVINPLFIEPILTSLKEVFPDDRALRGEGAQRFLEHDRVLVVATNGETGFKEDEIYSRPVASGSGSRIGAQQWNQLMKEVADGKVLITTGVDYIRSRMAEALKLTLWRKRLSEALRMTLPSGKLADVLRGAIEIRQVSNDLSTSKRGITKSLPSYHEADVHAGSARDSEDLLVRLQRLQNAFLEQLPVVPAALRPILPDGNHHPLNNLYQRVLRRKLRLDRLLSTDASQTRVLEEWRKLQMAVDDLFLRQPGGTAKLNGSFRVLLGGKGGLLRQRLLGKRVDLSGRAVIVPGPALHLGQVGLPRYVMKRLFDARGDETGSSSSAVSLPPFSSERERWVLLNRAPSLHRYNFMAFRAVPLEEGVHTIHLHPLVCGAFGADHDGDTMAVHRPVSWQGLAEAVERGDPGRNVLSVANGDLLLHVAQDIVLGVYYLSLRPKGRRALARLLDAPELMSGSNPVDAERLRALLVRLYRKKHLITGSVEKAQRRVVMAAERVKSIGFEMASQAGASLSVFDLRNLAKSIDIEVVRRDFDKTPVGLAPGLVDAEALAVHRKEQIQETLAWKLREEEQAVLGERIRPEEMNPLALMVRSGARGNLEQATQLVGVRGLMVKPSGELARHPITSSLLGGLPAIDYFTSLHGTRKSMVDKALSTAGPGEFTRQMVYAAQPLVIQELDCGTEEGLPVKDTVLLDSEEIDLGKAARERRVLVIEGKGRRASTFRYAASTDELLTELRNGDSGSVRALKVISLDHQIIGRVLARSVKDPQSGAVWLPRGAVVTHAKARELARKGVHEVSIRSPLTCKSRKGVCAMCYGWDLSRNELVEAGTPVGVLAGQSIGERGTQLTLRTFHTGGVREVNVTSGVSGVKAVCNNQASLVTFLALQGYRGRNRPRRRLPVLDEWSLRQCVQRIYERGRGQIVVKERQGVAQVTARQTRIFQTLIRPTDWLADVRTGSLQRYTRQAGGKARELLAQAFLAHSQRFYGTRVDNRHFEVLLRAITRLRTVEGDLGSQDNSISFLGLTSSARANPSFLARASFGWGLRVLADAGLAEETDPLEGYLEQLVVGKRHTMRT